MNHERREEESYDNKIDEQRQGREVHTSQVTEKC